MTKSADLYWLELDDPETDLGRKIIAAPHDVLPVRSPDPDEPYWFVSAKDILDTLLRTGEIDIAGRVRKPLVLPGRTSVRSLVEQLRENDRQAAILLDGNGSVEGFLTLADLLTGAVARDGVRPV